MRRLSNLVRKNPVARAFMRPLVRFSIKIYFKIKTAYHQFSTRPAATFFRPKSGPLEGRKISVQKALDYANGPAAIGIGSRAYGKQVVMLVVSDLRIDPRVEREARALVAVGYSVTVICPEPTQGQQPDITIDWGENIDFELLHWSAASFAAFEPGYLAYSIFQQALDYAPFAFHAHDASTAYVGLAAARTTGAHLVVDFHEWFSENVLWESERATYLPVSGKRRQRWQALEMRCLREASEVITVCDSIADAMANELGGGRRPHVIRNIPALDLEPTRPYVGLKEQLGISEDNFVVLYQGGLGPLRCLEPIIQALALERRFTLVIRGPGIETFGPGYRALAEAAGASERLILEPPVPSRDVVAAARGADVGIYSVVDLCKNFRFALPNKLFEYIASGLPVLTANYPEPSKIVHNLVVGECFEPHDPHSIAGAIGALIDNPARRQLFAANTKSALLALDADAEWRKLVTIYDSLKPSSAKKSRVSGL
jgi:glycosyltransferase involved in cell wall biosynthesis